MKSIVFLATISIFRMGGEIEVADAPNGARLRTMGGDIDIVRLEGSPSS